jgi:hypothetical protein
MPNRVKLIIQLIDKRDSGGNVHADNFTFRKLIKVFNQGTETVPVPRYENGFPHSKGRCDVFVPTRQNSFHGVFQAFRGRELLGEQGLIAQIVTGMPRIFHLKSGRPDVVATPPQIDLSFAILLRCFRFIQPLQGPIMPLIQAPIFVDGNPHEFHLIKHNPQGPNGTLQNRGERHVKHNPMFLQNSSGISYLFFAAIEQIDICPTGKEVLLIPLTLPMPQQNQLATI